MQGMLNPKADNLSSVSSLYLISVMSIIRITLIVIKQIEQNLLFGNFLLNLYVAYGYNL